MIQYYNNLITVPIKCMQNPQTKKCFHHLTYIFSKHLHEATKPGLAR